MIWALLASVPLVAVAVWLAGAQAHRTAYLRDHRRHLLASGSSSAPRRRVGDDLPSLARLLDWTAGALLAVTAVPTLALGLSSGSLSGLGLWALGALIYRLYPRRGPAPALPDRAREQ